MLNLKFKLTFAGLLFASSCLFAQNVVISDQSAATPDNSAMLDVQAANKGVLFPRMNSTVMNGIANPAVGLLIFNTETESFWYNTASGWTNLGSPWIASGDTVIYTPDRRVGIGLNNPLRALHVKGYIEAQANDSNDGEYFMSDENGDIRVHLNKVYSNASTSFRVEVLVPDTTGQATVTFFRNTNAATKRVEFFRGDNFGTERSAVIGVGDENSFFQASGGNFGIGTTAPSFLFDVNGTGIDNNGITAVARIRSGNGAQSLLLDGNEIDATADKLFINNNTTEDLILVNGGGSVGIGESNPTHVLHVNGIARSAQNTWATSSDRRIKTNIVPISNASALISRLNPVTFNWKKEYAAMHPGLHQHNYGFIAQEVEQVLPEMVTQVTDKVESNTEIKDFRVLNTDAILPLLVKASQEQQIVIKEQQQIIETQQKQLDELSSKMAALEALVQRTLANTSAIETSINQSKKE